MNFSWGSALSDGLIKGYSFGKLLRDDIAAGDYADDIKKSKAINDETIKSGLAKNQADYDKTISEGQYTVDPMGELIERLGPTESFNRDIEDAKAGLASKYGANTPEYKAALAQYLPELEQRRDANIQALKETQINSRATDATAHNEKIRTKALAIKQAADAQVRKEAAIEKQQADTDAARTYYARTGKIDKIQKLDDLAAFRDMLNDENKMNEYLLETYNASLPNGQRVLINQDGKSLSVIDAEGVVQGQLPMPSLAQRQEMMFSQIGRLALTSLDDTTANRALKLEETASNKAYRAAKLQMDSALAASKIAYYNAKSGGTAGSGGSGGTGYSSKGGLYFGNAVESGKKDIGSFQEVKDRNNGKVIGNAYINTNLFVPSTSKYETEIKKREDAQAVGVNYVMVRGNDAIANVYELPNGSRYDTLENALKAKGVAQGQNYEPKDFDSALAYHEARGGRTEQGLPMMFDHRGLGDMSGKEFNEEQPTNAISYKQVDSENKSGAEQSGDANTIGATPGTLPNVFGNISNDEEDIGRRTTAIPVPRSPTDLNYNQEDTENKSPRSTNAPVQGSATQGVKNNNPLCVSHSKTNNWKGQVGTNGKQAVFDTPEAGIRAGAKVVQANIKAVASKHGTFSIDNLIARYAPEVENNTKAYAKFVAKALGVESNRLLDKSDFKPGSDKIKKLLLAMIEFESGRGSSKQYKNIVNRIA